MKKVLKLFAVILTLFLIALIVVPMLYKDRIVELVKKEANKELNANVDFTEIGLSFFSNFPDFTLTLEDLTLINSAPFAGDTLINMPSFEIRLDLMSVVRGQIVKIEALTFDRPFVNLLVLEDGSVNWDIQKDTEEKVSDEMRAESELELSLRKYEINKGRLNYRDKSTGLMFEAIDFNHAGSGDFATDRFQLKTDTEIAALTLTMGGIDYLNKTQTRLKSNIDVNTLDSKFTLENNQLILNNLLLAFEGSIEAPGGEDLIFDLDFKAPNTEFKNVLSLIPAVFSKDFADLKSSGKVGLEGFVKGKYGDNDFPAFDLRLRVEKGQFQYRTLPTAVNNVEVDLRMYCPGGDLDRTVINLAKLHLELDKEPFDAKLQIQTPVSDPDISASLAGRVNLGEIKNAIPMENAVDLTGLIATKITFEGKASSIEKRDYGRLKALGEVTVEDVNYQGPDLPQRISVQKARLDFSPERVMLRDFVSKIGPSDLSADGTLEDVLAFVLSDQVLKGTLSTQSAFLDLNPFLGGPGGEWSAFQLPGNVEFTLNSSFQEVQYAKMKLQDVQGVLLLKDRSLRLMDLKMNALDGSVVVNGNYMTMENSPPQIFFDLRVEEVSIPKTFEHFVSVQRFVPVASSMHGNYGARLEVVSELDQQLMPVWKTFNSRGSLRVLQASLKDFKPLTMVAETVKIDQLRSLNLKEVHAVYKIKDGRFFLSPVKLSKENIDLVVSGSNGIDQSLDYTVQLNLPARELNQRTNVALTQLLNRKVELLTDESLLLNVRLKGSVDEPTVDFAMQEIIKGATDRARSAMAQGLQEKKVVLEDSIRVEIDKQKQELDRLKREAEEQAKQEKERLKKEAAKKLKKLIKSEP